MEEKKKKIAVKNTKTQEQAAAGSVGQTVFMICLLILVGVTLMFALVMSEAYLTHSPVPVTAKVVAISQQEGTARIGYMYSTNLEIEGRVYVTHDKKIYEEAAGKSQIRVRIMKLPFGVTLISPDELLTEQQ